MHFRWQCLTSTADGWVWSNLANINRESFPEHMRQQGIKNKVRMGKLPRSKRYYHWLQQTTYCVNMLDFYFVVSFFFRVHWELLPHVKNIFSHTRKKIPSSSTVLQGHADACLLWMVPCSRKIKALNSKSWAVWLGTATINVLTSFLFWVILEFEQHEMKCLRE